MSMRSKRYFGLNEIETRKEKLKDELYSFPVLPVNVR